MPLNLGRPVRFAPRAPRYATDTQSCVLLADDREIIVTIKNFTHRGFMAIASEPIGDAAELGISIPGYGIVRADVRWIDGMEFGGAFT
jgi:hypothetical protein